MLERLLREDRTTQLAVLKQVNDELDRRGEKQISQSAFYRFTARQRESIERMRQSREVAKVWIGELGSEPEGELGRLVIELGRTMAFDLQTKILEDDEPASAKVLQAVARAARDLEMAGKVSADRELAIRKETAKEAAQRAVTAAEEQSKASGHVLPPEALKAIREQVYGIVDG